MNKATNICEHCGKCIQCEHPYYECPDKPENEIKVPEFIKKHNEEAIKRGE